MMQPRKLFCGLTTCGVLAALCTLGCGPRSPLPHARVAGKITLNGQAIKQGNISFIPQGSGPARPAGVEFTGGAYRLHDAPLGSARVFITATKETGRLIAGSSEPVPEVVNIVPAKYRQGIEIEIAGDNDQLNFELTGEEGS